jgi:oligopeptide/dipeptide ABC transporter ATP-binding protein
MDTVQDDILVIRDLKTDLLTAQGIIYALGGVHLYIQRGEIHGLVGESGSGKSVTARVIMGLQNKKYTRITGTIMFSSTNPSIRPVHAEPLNMLHLSEKNMRHIRGQGISMIFQDPVTSLSPLKTIGRQLGDALTNHIKVSSAERRARVLSLLERVGLHPAAARARQYPFELSGGMQQRVMIAQAIACGPELLIADEPTTALDVTIQAQILKLLKDLQQELAMSVLLITHNFAVVAELCNRVSVMYAGQIVETAATESLIKAPAHPYSQSLIACIPRSSGTGDTMPRKVRLPVIRGSPPRLYQRQACCLFAPRCPRQDELCRTTPPPCIHIRDRMVLCHHPNADHNPGEPR